MTDFFERRKLRKMLKEYLHAAHHARNVREDITSEADLNELAEAEAAVRDIFNSGKGDDKKAVERLTNIVEKIYPAKNTQGMHELAEVLIVALGAAMAIRAFFFQPYKIPTGSMQPTLNGIIAYEQSEAGFLDHQPLKFFKWLATGGAYKTIKAKKSGEVIPFVVPGKGRQLAIAQRDNIIMNIGGVEHKIPNYLVPFLSIKKSYQKGDVIVGAKVVAGDHILVNKMKYNFMRPKRGDIAVFDTKDITHPQVRKDTFYIKRMVGMPGEKIQIRWNDKLSRGQLLADGDLIDYPSVFKKIDEDAIYAGHAFAPRGLLKDEQSYIQLANDQYLMMGDNTKSSLDGRYFGGVLQKDFQGPAFFVYWPFGSHWGVVE